MIDFIYNTKSFDIIHSESEKTILSNIPNTHITYIMDLIDYTLINTSIDVNKDDLSLEDIQQLAKMLRANISNSRSILSR